MRICSSCGKKNLAGFIYCQKCGAELAEPPADTMGVDSVLDASEGNSQVDADDAEEPLVLLLKQGKKLEAIKLYRQRTGAGLTEAKAVIERLRRQEAIETGDLEPQLLELLRSGQKIAAIRLYRNHTGAKLAEAKSAIEHVAAKHGLAPVRTGSTSALAIAMAVLLGIAVVCAAIWRGWLDG